MEKKNNSPDMVARSKPVEKPLKQTKYKGAVTFLDVLGWKGIWKENIGEDNQNPITRLSDFIELIRKEEKNFSAPYKHLLINESERGKDANVTVLSISDTIVFFTPGPAKETISIHAALCSWVLEEALKRKLPLRGAISYGEYDYKDQIMIGPAVDEAASWHESTDWIGVILTPSAKFALEAHIPKCVVEYGNIPFKKAVKGLNLCIDWNYTSNLYSNFINKGPHMQEVAPKYLNTLIFLESKENIQKEENKNKNLRHLLKVYRILLKSRN